MRTVINLDSNVMEHAQKTIFVYVWNGRVHILLEQTQQGVCHHTVIEFYLQCRRRLHGVVLA
jgi:hypothetical protein